MGKKKFEADSEYRVDFNDYSTAKVLTHFYAGSNPLAVEWSNNRPFNVSTGVDFNGVNRLLFSISPFKDSRFATSNQFKYQLGCPPIRGVTHKEKGLKRGFPYALFSVEQFPDFNSEYFPIKEPNTTYVENDIFVQSVHSLAETVENAVTVNFERLTSIILARFMAQDINYPFLGTIATSNDQWIKFIESDNTAISKASAEAQKRYNQILIDCGLVEDTTEAKAEPKAKATPKPTPKPKANTKAKIAKQKYKEIQKNMDPFGFVKAIDLSAFDKLGEKDLKRVMAILEKV